MKIMIVDDNKRIREMIKSLFTEQDIQFCECTDGSEAEAAYQLHKPDWVLMDVVMERTDGLSATRVLTRAFPDAKVLIVTEYDDTALRDEARHAGALGYIVKDNLSEIHQYLRMSK